MYKFQEALRKKVRMHVENEQLTQTYLYEKKKLETQMVKDNQKYQVIQKILKMVNDGSHSPRFEFKYERFNKRIKDQEKKKLKA